MRPRRIVVALGGNALARRGDPMTAETQRANVRRAVSALAPLISQGHRLVITHGNGPQVGLLALQAAAGPEDGNFPFDILGAESEGMIGYLIELELRNTLPAAQQIVTLLTHARVDPADPAFASPSKPIGPTYDEARARQLAARHHWTIAMDGPHWRRMVPSPRPVEFLQQPVISGLVGDGVTVICAGGGGIPVVREADGTLHGIEAVVDKDLASALLARVLDADHLLLLTDVPGIYLDWGHAPGRLVASAPPSALEHGRFASGSMAPKVEAANAFAAATGRLASVGSLEDAVAIIEGKAGTTIDANARTLRLWT